MLFLCYCLKWQFTWYGQNDQLQAVAADIQSCKQGILEITNKNEIRTKEDDSRVQSFVHVLRIFETEMLCHLKDWNAMKQTIAVSPLHLLIHCFHH